MQGIAASHRRTRHPAPAGRHSDSPVARWAAPRGRGFSLAELMIAIGILGIGLAMALSLFPAALKENERSQNSILGVTICENGLSLAKLVLKSTDLTASTLVDKTSSMPSTTYPYGTAGGSFGYIILGRFLGADSYQLVAVAYRKADTAHSVIAQSISCSTSGTSVTGAGGSLRTGSPLIDKGSGKYATILTTTNNYSDGTLDRDIGAVTSAYVIQESGVPDISPAMATLVTKTGLRR